MNKNFLVDSNLMESILNASALTQTGLDILEKYQSYALNNPISCTLVNNLIKECSNHLYDTALQQSLEPITAFIQDHQVSWSLLSVVESINNSNRKYDLLNKNAASKVEKLLENRSEQEVINFIRSGVLKDTMYCEGIRNVVKQVFNNQSVIEHTTEYTRHFPVAYMETVMEDGEETMYTVVNKELYCYKSGEKVQKGDWRNVSNTFKIVSSLLESDAVSLAENTNADIKIYFNENTYYVVDENGELSKHSKINNEKTVFDNISQFRDQARLMVMASSNAIQKRTAQFLESIALLVENYSNVFILNNTSIYETKKGNFLVIENGNYLYAKNISTPVNFEVNENALEVVSFLKSKLNVDINEYDGAIEKVVESQSRAEKALFESNKKQQEIDGLKVRIEQLTEQYKNDPVKLAVIGKLASDLGSI